MSWAFELIDVHVTRGGQPILRGVDLGAKMGEVTVLHGPAGSGKTAVFRTVIGLERPDQGAVFVAGKEISRAKGHNLQKIQRRMGVMFAGDGGLFASKSVLENVGIAMASAGRVPARKIAEVALEELERFELLEHRDLRPGQLSPAQQRCLALARALSLRSPLVVVDGLDEALDPVTAERMCAAVHEDARRNGTSFLVTVRDTHVVGPVADQLVELHAGSTQ